MPKRFASKKKEGEKKPPTQKSQVDEAKMLNSDLGSIL